MTASLPRVLHVAVDIGDAASAAIRIAVQCASGFATRQALTCPMFASPPPQGDATGASSTNVVVSAWWRRLWSREIEPELCMWVASQHDESRRATTTPPPPQPTAPSTRLLLRMACRVELVIVVDDNATPLRAQQALDACRACAGMMIVAASRAPDEADDSCCCSIEFDIRCARTSQAVSRYFLRAQCGDGRRRGAVVLESSSMVVLDIGHSGSRCCVVIAAASTPECCAQSCGRGLGLVLDLFRRRCVESNLGAFGADGRSVGATATQRALVPAKALPDALLSVWLRHPTNMLHGADRRFVSGAWLAMPSVPDIASDALFAAAATVCSAGASASSLGPSVGAIVATSLISLLRHGNMLLAGRGAATSVRDVASRIVVCGTGAAAVEGVLTHERFCRLLSQSVTGALDALASPGQDGQVDAARRLFEAATICVVAPDDAAAVGALHL